MISGLIPPGRIGVYIGILNKMFVIPMLPIALTLPLFCAAAAVFWTREPRDAANAAVATT